MADAKWYVVHTYSGYENKVAQNIEKVVENQGFGDLIFEVKIPTEKVVEYKDDKKRDPADWGSRFSRYSWAFQRHSVSCISEKTASKEESSGEQA